MQRLQAIARASPVDEVALLDAALVAATEDELLEQGKRAQAKELVADAGEVYPAAWDFLRRAGEARSQALLGCSKEMLVLAARLALLLHELVARREAHAREHAEARDRARRNLQDAFDRAVKLRDQARRVLGKIAGADESLREQANEAALAEDSGGSVLDALGKLATLAKRLLSSPDATLTQRIRLYGVNEGYAELMAAACVALQAAEREFEGLASQDGSPDRRIHWCAGANLALMSHVLEAFLGAHELDPSVPFVHPAHHEHLVRRVSRIPPPPAPKGLSQRQAAAPRHDALAQHAPGARAAVRPPAHPAKRS